MNIEIKRIGIFLGPHCDTVWLYFDLPPAMFGDSSLDVSFKASYRTGLEYVRKNFPGVPVEMIDLHGNETRPENPERRTNDEGGKADVDERQEADSGGGGPR